MTVVEIPDFVKGRTTRKGRALPPDEAPQPFLATVVTRDAIHYFLGSRSDRERDAHLRRLRRLGLLVTEPGRLTQRVRTGKGRERVRACVSEERSDQCLAPGRHHRWSRTGLNAPLRPTPLSDSLLEVAFMIH